MKDETKAALPDGWRWVKLGEVCEFIRGVGFDKSQVRMTATENYLPILRAGNIQEQLELENDLIWVPDELVSQPQRMVLYDIAICMSSGSPAIVGKTATLRQDFKGSVGAFCGLIRARKNVNAAYMSNWFRSAEYIEWRDEKARGANIQNLRFSDLALLQILLPTDVEQERIALTLHNQLTNLEEARVAAEAQLETLKLLPSALLRTAFTIHCHEQPTANSQQPTANSQQPTANSQQPTANNKRKNSDRVALGAAWRGMRGKPAKKCDYRPRLGRAHHLCADARH